MIEIKQTSRQIMDHPYWTEVLALPEFGGFNKYVSQIIKKNQDLKRDFLQLIAEGFYPISVTSPIAFHRVAELSESGETQKIAQMMRVSPD